MSKYYETDLPDGYTVAQEVNVQNRALCAGLTVASLLPPLLLILVGGLLLRGRIGELFSGITSLHLLALGGSLLLYIPLHELTHGAAYKCLTGHKLTFGISLTAAYCGVPDIYVYRRAALIALLSPTLLFSAVFLLPAFLLPGAVWRAMFALLFAIHLGGCCGDLYDTWLYLTRYRAADVLMRDYGPRQVFYTKTETDR